MSLTTGAPFEPRERDEETEQPIDEGMPTFGPVPEGPLASVEPSEGDAVAHLLDDLAHRAGSRAAIAVNQALDARWGTMEEAVAEWKNPIAWFIRGYLMGAASVLVALLGVVLIGKLFLEATAR